MSASHLHLLYPGVLMRFAGKVWRIVSYVEGGKVWLQDPDDDDVNLPTLLSELLRTGVRVDDEQPETPASVTGALAVSLERLHTKDPTLAQWAERYYDDVLEARTGYRRGSPELALPGEPKPEYDPTTKTLDERLDALISSFERLAEMAEELGDDALAAEFRRRGGKSTIKRHWMLAHKGGRGFRAFVDGRRLRQRRPFGNLDPRIKAAMERVWRRQRAKGEKLRLRHFRNQVRVELDKSKDKKTRALKLPSEKTFNKHLAVMLATQALSGPMSYQRSRWSMPDAEFDPAIASYPGQFVYVDLVSTNMFAFEEYTYGRVVPNMLVALDAYSATVLAVRFIVGEPTAGDVVGLILDICFPKRWRPQWGDEEQWRTAGVPGNLVLGFKVDSLILDNALANAGRRVRMACEKLEIDIFFARLAAGEDKARLERFFGTVDDQLWQGLSFGYRGRNVASRGKKPERRTHFFISELEDKFWEWVTTHWQPKPHKNIWPAGHPRASLSPNAAFDLGMRKAPPVSMPISRDLLWDTGEPITVTIGRAGIRFRHFDYSCPELQDWKGKQATYRHYGGKWLAFWDPDDRRFLHLQLPHPTDATKFVWVHPDARELRMANRPMSQDDVDYLRAQLIEEYGTAKPTLAQWDKKLNEWLVEQYKAAERDARARRAYVKRKLRELESKRLEELADAAAASEVVVSKPEPGAPQVEAVEDEFSGELLFADPAMLERLRVAAEAEDDGEEEDAAA